MPCCKQNSCRVKPLSRHWRTRVNMYSLRSLISIIFGRKAKDDHLNRKYAVGRADTYEQLVFDTKAKGYLQVDETPIKVLDSDKKGAAHQGYYWVYHAPLDGTVLFDYSPTRGSSAPLPILGSFRGYLQTDGYAVYEKYARSK